MDITATGTELEVCKDIADRQRKGIAKYGCTVSDNRLRLKEWLRHAYEETLDQAIYLKRAIIEIDEEELIKHQTELEMTRIYIEELSKLK